MDKMMIEKVARAIRRGRYERNGRGNAYDPSLPLHETELADAAAAISAYNPDDRLREALEKIVLQRQLGKNADVLVDIARSALSPLPQATK